MDKDVVALDAAQQIEQLPSNLQATQRTARIQLIVFQAMQKENRTMAIKHTLTHEHRVSIPLAELMDYLLKERVLLGIPRNARLEVVDNDDAGYQVVYFSWCTQEESIEGNK